ncbi:MAG: purine-binding chemotaxis protein CheW [Deltaproteobacteria bacterium]|nr:purine-binding chemotaxis protein CheW [Deltaproteobacteria bacterium]
MATNISDLTIRMKNLVGFRVGEVPYAVDIYRVREITKPLPLLTLPHMPAEVIGVVDHRGDVVPVIDLRIRFGLQPRESRREERWIIVKRSDVLIKKGDRLAGLVVDKVTEVFGAGESQQRGVPEIGKGNESRGIASAYSYKGKLVFVIDVDRITSIADEVDTQEVHKQLQERSEQ